jgi:hypothetical protein
LREVDGVAVWISDMRDSLAPRHVVWLAFNASAQSLHPVQQAIDVLDGDAEEDSASGPGSGIGIGDKAQFGVADAKANVEAGPSSGTRNFSVASRSFA